MSLRVDKNKGLNFICKKKAADAVSWNIKIWLSLWIFFLIPAWDAPGERPFSKLALIKTWLRSTKTQERLTGLVILYMKQKFA